MEGSSRMGLLPSFNLDVEPDCLLSLLGRTLGLYVAAVNPEFFDQIHERGILGDGWHQSALSSSFNRINGDMRRHPSKFSGTSPECCRS